MIRTPLAAAASLGLLACTPDASLLSDGGEADVDAAQPVDSEAPGIACPAGTTNTHQTRTTSISYLAAHLASNPPHEPFEPICLPISAAGQAFYLQSNAIRGNCTAYDACETSLEIKCFDAAGVQLHPQLYSGENFLQGAASTSLIARMMFIATAPGLVLCRAEFFDHDHGIAGGAITVRAGSTFAASGPLGGSAATADSGGGAHLTRAQPTAALKPLSGWRMLAGRSRVTYIGDIQATECHVKYPGNATNPATQCTVGEAGTDTTLEYNAVAVEEYADGRTCHITSGQATIRTIDTRTHHKMLYTQVVADHTPGCANVWRFDVFTRWQGGRSVMVQSGPYGQGMVRAL